VGIGVGSGPRISGLSGLRVRRGAAMITVLLLRGSRRMQRLVSIMRLRRRVAVVRLGWSIVILRTRSSVALTLLEIAQLAFGATRRYQKGSTYRWIGRASLVWWGTTAVVVVCRTTALIGIRHGGLASNITSRSGAKLKREKSSF
jgi:hypothetical protein